MSTVNTRLRPWLDTFFFSRIFFFYFSIIKIRKMDEEKNRLELSSPNGLRFLESFYAFRHFEHFFLKQLQFRIVMNGIFIKCQRCFNDHFPRACFRWYSRASHNRSKIYFPQSFVIPSSKSLLWYVQRSRMRIMQTHSHSRWVYARGAQECRT